MASSQFCVFISLMRPQEMTATRVFLQRSGENGCCLQILRAHLSEETSQEKMRLCSVACISRLARPAFHINHCCGYFWLHACDNLILPLYINLVCIHSTGLLLMSFLRPAYVNNFMTSVVFINYILFSWFCSRVIIVNWK